VSDVTLADAMTFTITPDDPLGSPTIVAGASGAGNAYTASLDTTTLAEGGYTVTARASLASVDGAVSPGRAMVVDNDWADPAEFAGRGALL
ncbi:hypothetical protein, partial [Escherichia coli]